jgi:catechol 2,3-dioxygenase-like lactoylglutathione lyase family enzyme
VASKLGNIVFDCVDPARLSSFWADVFGYPPAEWPPGMLEQLHANGVTDDDIALRGVAQDPTGEGPRLFFQKVPEAKVVKNRVHVDINATAGRRATAEEVDAEKDRIVGLGASVLKKYDSTWGGFREYHYVMADPEGNEFCIQ